jgi:membrane-anchored glycerophosphoryl diester phosphodiesterase (GDPDase)
MAISFFVLIMMLVGFFAIAFVLGAQLAGAGLTQQDFQGDPTPAAEKLSDALGQQGMMIFGLMLGVILVAAIWVNARLILAGPATVAEGRMLAFTTWSWTKGNGWRIVAALILTCMPGFLVSNLVASLVGQAAGLNREQLNAPGTMVTAFVASFLVLWLVYGPFAGLSTYLYRGFRPQT